MEVLIDNPDGSFLQKGDHGEVVSDILDDGMVAVNFSFEFEDAHKCELEDGTLLVPNYGWFIHKDNLKNIE